MIHGSTTGSFYRMSSSSQGHFSWMYSKATVRSFCWKLVCVRCNNSIRWPTTKTDFNTFSASCCTTAWPVARAHVSVGISGNTQQYERRITCLVSFSTVPLHWGCPFFDSFCRRRRRRRRRSCRLSLWTVISRCSHHRKGVTKNSCTSTSRRDRYLQCLITCLRLVVKLEQGLRYPDWNSTENTQRNWR